MNTSSDAIRNLIRTSNHAWREGRLDVLADLLHPEVAFVGPRLEVQAEGRDACLCSYEEFIARAEIHAFVENAADIRITGSTAVATYEWSIAYSIAGRRHEERGREILVCTHGDCDGDWKIAWRAQFRGDR